MLGRPDGPLVAHDLPRSGLLRLWGRGSRRSLCEWSGLWVSGVDPLAGRLSGWDNCLALLGSVSRGAVCGAAGVARLDCFGDAAVWLHRRCFQRPLGRCECNRYRLPRSGLLRLWGFGSLPSHGCLGLGSAVSIRWLSGYPGGVTAALLGYITGAVHSAGSVSWMEQTISLIVCFKAVFLVQFSAPMGRWCGLGGVGCFGGPTVQVVFCRAGRVGSWSVASPLAVFPAVRRCPSFSLMVQLWCRIGCSRLCRCCPGWIVWAALIAVLLSGSLSSSHEVS